MAEYIELEGYIGKEALKRYLIDKAHFYPVIVKNAIESIPAADVVAVEKYNDLREAFVDFVCSGVHNPAPYCKNRSDECVNNYGYCTFEHCKGFNPDGERKEK